MNPIDKLTELFKEFPGIGPRQAKRFVYFLLLKNQGYVNELASLIPEIKKSVTICDSCFRYFPKNESQTNTCKICLDKNRDPSLLMVVSRDTDFDAVQKSHQFKGYYFILGGIVPVMEDNHQKFIRLRELKEEIGKRKQNGLQEVILALNATTEGDFTTDLLKKELKDFDIKISILGRGLSTGTELEYSDKETILNALNNRK